MPIVAVTELFNGYHNMVYYQNRKGLIKMTLTNQEISNEMTQIVDNLNTAWLLGYTLREQLGLLEEHDNEFEKLTDQINSLTVLATKMRDKLCQHENYIITEPNYKICTNCFQTIDNEVDSILSDEAKQESNNQNF